MSGPSFDVENVDWVPKALDVMAYQGISEAEVIGVLQHPDAWAREATRQNIGVAWRLRRGDVVVTVGMADPARPLILHVRRRRYQDEHKVSSGRTGNLGVRWPRSYRELKKMVVALGYSVRESRNGRNHEDIIDPSTGYRIAQISSTPSDQNSYEATYRAVLNYHRTSKVVG